METVVSNEGRRPSAAAAAVMNDKHVESSGAQAIVGDDNNQLLNQNVEKNLYTFSPSAGHNLQKEMSQYNKL